MTVRACGPAARDRPSVPGRRELRAEFTSVNGLIVMLGMIGLAVFLRLNGLVVFLRVNDLALVALHVNCAASTPAMNGLISALGVNAPGPRSAGALLAWGLDFRGHGGFVLLPPSLHSSGTRYTWGEKVEQGDPLRDLPRWIDVPRERAWWPDMRELPPSARA